MFNRRDAKAETSRRTIVNALDKQLNPRHCLLANGRVIYYNMSVDKTEKSQIQIKQPAQYVFSHMVNRFTLKREKGFVIAYFGLLDGNDVLIDSFSCIIPKSTLESNKENLVEFSEKIGPPKNKIPSWNPPKKSDSVTMDNSVVDFIHLTNWEDAHAEICFWNYSRAGLSDLVNIGGTQVLTPWGIALLRCDIDLQRAFLVDLYAE